MNPEFELLDGEIWKEIPNYEYFISNYGRLFRKNFPDIVMNKDRKDRICLNNGKSQNMLKTVSVMYRSFIGDIPGGYFVHCDGDLRLCNIKLKKKASRPKVNRDTTSLPGEVWKDIPNFPMYMISNMGRVLSKGSKHFPPHIMNVNSHNNKTMTLMREDGAKCAISVKTVLAEVFYSHKIDRNEFIVLENKKPVVHNRNEIERNWTNSDFQAFKASKYYRNPTIVENFNNGKYNTEEVECLSIYPYEFQCKVCGRKLFPKRPIKHCSLCKEEYINDRKERNNKLRILRDKIHHAIQRCENPNLGYQYEKYGGKGIRVINYWKNSENFVNWCLSECDGDLDKAVSLSIDRIDPRYEYAPYNCQLIPRWANSRKMIDDKKRTRAVLFIDKICYEIRKKNWIKHMKSLGYYMEDLI